MTPHGHGFHPCMMQKCAKGAIDKCVCWNMYFCNFANLISYERLRELFGMKHSFYYVCLGFEDFKTLKYFISCSCLQLIIKNSFEQLKNDFWKRWDLNGKCACLQKLGLLLVLFTSTPECVCLVIFHDVCWFFESLKCLFSQLAKSFM